MERIVQVQFRAIKWHISTQSQVIAYNVCRFQSVLEKDLRFAFVGLYVFQSLDQHLGLMFENLKTMRFQLKVPLVASDIFNKYVIAMFKFQIVVAVSVWIKALFW